MINDFNYELFPFILVKSLNELYIVQVTTGKQLRVSVNLDIDAKNNKGGELERASEIKKMIQINNQHIMIADGNLIKVISLEVNVKHDAYIS